MEVGEHWAYATSDTPFWFLEARIIRLDGSYAVVVFIDEDGVEGRPFRKPVRNLRAPWENWWEFLQNARIRKADDNAEFDAVQLVFERFIGLDIATAWDRSNDIDVFEPAKFSELTGVSLAAIETGDLDRYTVARDVAAMHADELAQIVTEDERSAIREATVRARNSAVDWVYVYDDAEIRERIALEAGRLTRRRNSVLRAWAGQAAVDLARDNENLRIELLRVRVAAHRAVDALASEARTKRIERLALELGQELES